MMWDGMTWGPMLVWLVVSVLLIGLLIAGTIWLVRNVGSDGGRAQTPTSSQQTPREVIDRRYARGEIDREQYVRLRDDLDGPGR